MLQTNFEIVFPAPDLVVSCELSHLARNRISPLAHEVIDDRVHSTVTLEGKIHSFGVDQGYIYINIESNKYLNIKLDFDF